jgi:hypothetical protein
MLLVLLAPKGTDMTTIQRCAPILFVVLTLQTLSPAVSAAQEGAGQPGSAAQKRACRPDVYRLCPGEIPNVRDIVRCLRANMTRLSPDCRAVFSNG